MTEKEWLDCAGPKKMLTFLNGVASERKLRLFACGCCRRIWHLFNDEWSPAAVEMAEQFADRLVTGRRLTESNRAIYGIIRLRMRVGSPEVFAANAAKCASTIGRPRSYDALTAAETALLAASARGKLLANRPRSPDAAERKRQCRLLRCIFGNPFRRVHVEATWKTQKAKALAKSIYGDRRFGDLPILVDALEAAGCTNAEILDHCRRPGEHVRGCWVLDLLLGKE